MSSGRLTRATLRTLDWITRRFRLTESRPAHLDTGRRGEEDAYFYLRNVGYTIVARNFRSPNRRGEIDLIAWREDVLCFIEVKTRTTHAVQPAEAAVDRDKRRDILAVAQDYLRQLPHSCPWRLDIVSVYYDAPSRPPKIELFQNVPPLA